MAEQGSAAWTNQQLADALGLAVRTVQREKGRGLPLPAAGEHLASWAARARAWRAAHKQRTGPKVDPAAAGDQVGLAHWNLRYRQARALRETLALQRERGEVHSKADCEREQVQRLLELRAFFVQLPDRLARRLFQAPSPEAIKVEVEAELRHAFEALQRGDAPPAPEPTEDAEP